MDMTQSTFEIKQRINSANLIGEAQNLAARGERDQAYRLSLEATRTMPEDIDAWFLRATTAASLEERLVCLSRLYALDPQCYRAWPSMYDALRDLIRQEPYLGYIDETDDLYRVKSGLELYLNVPKSRAVPQAYPAAKHNPLKGTYTWLILAIFGLLLGGVSAIVLAPAAIASSLLLQLKPLSHDDRIRSLIAMTAAFLIWLAAIPIAVLFVIHVIQR
jgi:hypothetical protein